MKKSQLNTIQKYIMEDYLKTPLLFLGEGLGEVKNILWKNILKLPLFFLRRGLGRGQNILWKNILNLPLLFFKERAGVNYYYENLNLFTTRIYEYDTTG
jgi:hypothetical protein